MSEEIKIDGIPIQDYGTPNSRNCYPGEINIGETIKNNIDYWKNLYFEEKEKNEELLKDNNVLNRLVYFNKNITFPYEIELTSTNEFVSKDKIRAKIKELENELKYENFRDGNLIQINVLKKLLQEE